MAHPFLLAHQCPMEVSRPVVSPLESSLEGGGSCSGGVSGVEQSECIWAGERCSNCQLPRCQVSMTMLLERFCCKCPWSLKSWGQLISELEKGEVQTEHVMDCYQLSFYGDRTPPSVLPAQRFSSCMIYEVLMTETLFLLEFGREKNIFSKHFPC